MKLPFLSSLIVFIIWLSYEIKKSNRKSEQNLQDFLDREAEADRTPAKPIHDLPYISIPLEELPLDLCSDDDTVKDCIDTVRSLSTQKILNLSGFSNTDLKLMYGAPNIHKLTACDQNYTALIQALNKWSKRLIAKGENEAAFILMEFAVSTGTDSKSTYMALAEHYLETGENEKIKWLLNTAGTINSISRDNIVAALELLVP